MNENLKQLYEQLGRGLFFMLGAYNQQYDNKESFLSFRIKGSRKVNYIRITYDIAHDLYNLHFSRIGRKFEEKDIQELNGIYSDQLHDLIEEYTELSVRVPKIIFTN